MKYLYITEDIVRVPGRTRSESSYVDPPQGPTHVRTGLLRRLTSSAFRLKNGSPQEKTPAARHTITRRQSTSMYRSQSTGGAMRLAPTALKPTHSGLTADTGSRTCGLPSVPAAEARLRRGRALAHARQLARGEVLDVGVELPGSRRAAQPAHGTRRQKPAAHELLAQAWMVLI